MKQLLEVGDRVRLIGGKFVGEFIDTTGIVSHVGDNPYDDGARPVTFVLSDEDRTRLGRDPGYLIVTRDTNLKYLKPKKDKAAKVDEKYAKRLDKLGDLTMEENASAREAELVVGLSLTLAALDVLTYVESTESADVKALKKAMLAELR